MPSASSTACKGIRYVCMSSTLSSPSRRSRQRRHSSLIVRRSFRLEVFGLKLSLKTLRGGAVYPPAAGYAKRADIDKSTLSPLPLKVFLPLPRPAHETHLSTRQP